MAGANFIKRLCEKCTCSICRDYFTDPVSTDCGHSFCRACLIQSWEVQGGNPSCPSCQEPATPAELVPNPVLSNFVEISKEFSLQAANGTLCQRHLEPLTLFCMDDKAPICAECHKSEVHRGHTVIPGRDDAE